jgi:hypothetical protein
MKSSQRECSHDIKGHQKTIKNILHLFHGFQKQNRKIKPYYLTQYLIQPAFIIKSEKIIIIAKNKCNTKKSSRNFYSIIISLNAIKAPKAVSGH